MNRLEAKQKLKNDPELGAIDFIEVFPSKLGTRYFATITADNELVDNVNLQFQNNDQLNQDLCVRCEKPRNNSSVDYLHLDVDIPRGR